MVSITENEKDVLLNGIGKNDFFDDYEDQIWSECVVDSCKTVTKKQISGVIGSLVRKGLVGSNEETVYLTRDGIDQLKELREAASRDANLSYDRDYPSWEAWATHQDNLGQIDALMCHIAKKGDKYQTERMAGIVDTFMKRLRNIDQEIED